MPKATKESIDNQIEALHEKKVKIHLDEERAKLKEIKCGLCDESLGINPDDFMSVGTKAKLIVCPKCDMQNRVQVVYQEDPEDMGEGIITKTLKDYAWETKSPGKFDEDNLKKWFERESKRITENRSRFPQRETQILIMALNMVLNGD